MGYQSSGRGGAQEFSNWDVGAMDRDTRQQFLRFVPSLDESVYPKLSRLDECPGDGPEPRYTS
jgi:hypothetical protein